MADSVQSIVFANLINGLVSVLGIDASRCFEVSRPEDLPTIPPGNDWFMTICWGDSNWPMGEQAVGNFTEEPEISLTIYTRLKTDQAGHDKYLLRDSKAGLFILRDTLIRALIGRRLCASARETIKIRHSTSGEVIKNTRDGTFLGKMRLVFAAPYDIDITDG